MHQRIERFAIGCWIYRSACRIQQDGRMNVHGRAEKTEQLLAELKRLCKPHWDPEAPKSTGAANDFRLLVNEIMRLAERGELFLFVTAEPVTQPNGATKPVSGTNNEAERTLRNPSQARDTGRANKTASGTRRQTVLASVLESLRLYLQKFTLKDVLAEVMKWTTTGISCFRRLVKKLKLKVRKNVLDDVIPIPTG
jgi:transposase